MVAGDGQERSGLEDLAQVKLAGRVHFVGPLESPFFAYAAGNVMVLPSLSDSMPATSIEAGLSGLPAIATSIGSIEDVVIDGETGLLVESGDKKALAPAILRLSNDPALSKSMGLKAHQHCLGSFEIRAVAKHLLTAINEVSSWSPTLFKHESK